MQVLHLSRYLLKLYLEKLSFYMQGSFYHTSPREYHAMVSFYINLDGEITDCYVKDLSVDEIDIDNVGYAKFGGFIAHKEITEQDRAVFNYAVKDLLSVEYDIKAVSTHIVNGINYKFVCVVKFIVPYAQPEFVIIDVYTKFRHSIAPII